MHALDYASIYVIVVCVKFNNYYSDTFLLTFCAELLNSVIALRDIMLNSKSFKSNFVIQGGP